MKIIILTHGKKRVFNFTKIKSFLLNRLPKLILIVVVLAVLAWVGYQDYYAELGKAIPLFSPNGIIKL